MNKTLLFTLIALVVFMSIGAVRFFWLGRVSQKGNAPGLVSGRLTQCPETPNCVCTEFENDEAHYFQPVYFSPDANPDLMSKVKEVLTQMGGAIAAEDTSYVAATFTLPVFGFVDDFECRVEWNEGRLHFRSASRVGHSDLGVNRKRAANFVRLLSPRLEQQGAGGS